MDYVWMTRPVQIWQPVQIWHDSGTPCGRGRWPLSVWMAPKSDFLWLRVSLCEARCVTLCMKSAIWILLDLSTLNWVYLFLYLFSTFFSLKLFFYLESILSLFLIVPYLFSQDVSQEAVKEDCSNHMMQINVIHPNMAQENQDPVYVSVIIKCDKRLPPAHGCHLCCKFKLPT